MNSLLLSNSSALYSSTFKGNSCGLKSSTRAARLAINSTGRKVFAELDLNKIVSEENREKAGQVLKGADKKLRDLSSSFKEKAGHVHEELLQTVSKTAEELAVQAGETAEQLIQHTESAATQLKSDSERAAANLLESAETVASQAVEIAKDELERVSESAPDGVKELAEVALEAHSEEKAKKGAVIHDFCLGIPYGALLVVGGLIWFVVSGSLHALRFGTVLGGLLLATSVQSLGIWQAGKSTTRYIVVQAAIALVVALKEASRFVETGQLFPTLILAIVSTLMFGFYGYVVVAGGPPKKKAKADVASITVLDG